MAKANGIRKSSVPTKAHNIVETKVMARVANPITLEVTTKVTTKEAKVARGENLVTLQVVPIRLLDCAIGSRTAIATTAAADTNTRVLAVVVRLMALVNVCAADYLMPPRLMTLLMRFLQRPMTLWRVSAIQLLNRSCLSSFLSSFAFVISGKFVLVFVLRSHPFYMH